MASRSYNFGYLTKYPSYLMFGAHFNTDAVFPSTVWVSNTYILRLYIHISYLPR